jgi:hypothetical protein
MLNDYFIIEDGVLLKYEGEDKEVVVPNEVKIIGEKAFFWNVNLTNIILPFGITKIGESAFEWCISLESIVIPSNVTFVGSNAFWDTAGIQNVTFAGTTSQWNAIEFDDDWNDCLHVTVIHCTDGDIVLS